MTDIVQPTQSVNTIDAFSSAELLTIVYDELHKLATARLRHQDPNNSLQATALVHEVYLKLIGSKQIDSWQNRSHFFAAASEAMRRIVIDLYRRKQSLKRGGGRANRIDVDLNLIAIESEAVDLLSINEALDALEHVDAQKALLVKLKFFVGMNMTEAAAILGVSVPTAERYWRYSRAFLSDFLAG